MKNRTLAYFKKNKARKIFENAKDSDLTTFLTATFVLCRSRVVKNHIKSTIQELQTTYRLTA